MDGYDVRTTCLTAYKGKTLETLKARHKLVDLYVVYTIENKIKHCHQGYQSYSDMIAAHPELHDVAMIKALPLLNSR